MKKEIISPCGLYCGVCAIYTAHQKGDLKSKKLALAIYKSRAKSDATASLGVDDIKCDGCRSKNVFKYCQVCEIRNCANRNGFESCHQCKEFPCKHIEAFPIPPAKDIIKNTIPLWKEMGTEKWIQYQEEKYTCKNCGTKMFRGASRCGSCHQEI